MTTSNIPPEMPRKKNKGSRQGHNPNFQQLEQRNQSPYLRHTQPTSSAHTVMSTVPSSLAVQNFRNSWQPDVYHMSSANVIQFYLSGTFPYLNFVNFLALLLYLPIFFRNVSTQVLGSILRLCRLLCQTLCSNLLLHLSTRIIIFYQVFSMGMFRRTSVIIHLHPSCVMLKRFNLLSTFALLSIIFLLLLSLFALLCVFFLGSSITQLLEKL